MSLPSRSPFDRARWAESDARAALAALERSGKSVRAFAEEHGSTRSESTCGAVALPRSSEATVPRSVS